MLDLQGLGGFIMGTFIVGGGLHQETMGCRDGLKVIFHLELCDLITWAAHLAQKKIIWGGGATKKSLTALQQKDKTIL